MPPTKPPISAFREHQAWTKSRARWTMSSTRSRAGTIVMNDLMSGGPSPALEGPARRRWCNPPKPSNALRTISTSRAARAMSPSESRKPGARGTACHRSRHQCRYARDSDASALRNAGSLDAADASSRPMPRNCRSKTRASTPIRSPSASATCPASTVPWPKPIGY